MAQIKLTCRKLRSLLVREILRSYHKFSCKVKQVFTFKDLKLFVPCGIFEPSHTLSTSMLINILDLIKPRGNALDFGCGSGVLSIYIAKRFNVSRVFCYDINNLSRRAARINIIMNNVANKVVVIDNLKNISSVDLIVSNPPYLTLDPRDALDFNWCGGSTLKTFRELLKVSKKILRGRFLLITYSSLTGLKEVKEITEKFGFRDILTVRKRTPLDTIYASLFIEASRPSVVPLFTHQLIRTRQTPHPSLNIVRHISSPIKPLYSCDYSGVRL